MKKKPTKDQKYVEKILLKPLIKYIESKGLNPNSPMITSIPYFPKKLVKRKNK